MAEIKSAGISIEMIMGKLSDASDSIGRQIMLFIRPALAIVMSGGLLQLSNTLVGASSFTVQNVELSICSANIRRLAGLNAKDRDAH